MVARNNGAKELVAGLVSEVASERINALRQIKNQVIGNKCKKMCFLKIGAVRSVLTMLLSERDSEVQAQSATTLGSLTCGTAEGVEQLLQCSGVEGLVTALSSPDPKVVEACMRALKLIYSQAGSLVPHEPILRPHTLAQLVSLLLDLAQPDVAEAAALVLAHCGSSEEEQRILTEAGVAEASIGLLLSERKPLQVASLHLLSCLLKENTAACQRLLSPTRPSSSTSAGDGTKTVMALLETLLLLLRDPRPLTRFMAACCLTQLATSPVQPVQPVSPVNRPEASELMEPEEKVEVEEVGRLRHSMRDEQGHERRTQTSSLSEETVSDPMTPARKLEGTKAATLPVLLRLLSEPGVLERVPPVLAKLIEFSDELQKAALDADAVRHLACMLTSSLAAPSAKTTAQQQQQQQLVNLGAIFSPSPTPEEVAATAQLPPAAVLCRPSIGRSHQEGVLQALSCLCMDQSVGRKQLIEAKVLKQIVASLEHANSGVRAAAAKCMMALSRSIANLRGAVLDAEVAVVLCRLLGDKCRLVQVNAAGALCNLGLDFSSVKNTVLSSGALGHLVRMASSDELNVRVQACWALRNLVYKSDDVFRRQLMLAVPWPRMRQLMTSDSPCVQEHVMGMLRNMIMGPESSIHAVADWGGADLLAALEEKLDPSSGAQCIVVEHALYTVVNLLTGGERHKDAVMRSNMPALLVHQLRNPACTAELRVPTLWCIINLTWLEGANHAAVTARVQKLRELGVEAQLRLLLRDPSKDVVERAHNALERFDAVDGGGSDTTGGTELVGRVFDVMRELAE